MSNVQRFWCHEAKNIRCVRESDYAKLEAEAQALREEVAVLRARVVVPEDLLQRCREILEWQATGILKGDALRSYCQSKIWGRDPSALRMGEGETAQEAYRFIDELARLNGKAVSEGLLRRFYEANVTSEDFDQLGALLDEGEEVGP